MISSQPFQLQIQRIHTFKWIGLLKFQLKGMLPCYLSIRRLISLIQQQESRHIERETHIEREESGSWGEGEEEIKIVSDDHLLGWIDICSW